jgi:L-fuconolactonase
MKVIDSHVHFWQFDAVRDAWITPDMQVIRRDFYPAHIAPLLNENNIAGIVAVQADQSDTETAFLLQLAKENPFIKGVVGWIDLTHRDIEDRLLAYKNEPNLRGFRHIAEGEADGFLTRNDVVRGIGLLGNHGFTYDILVRHHRLHDAIGLSEKLPAQPFMLDHCAKPALRTNQTENWATALKELAQNPNIYCKLSGLLTESHWHNCDEKSIYNCLDVVFDAFSTQRVAFGSDWPVMLLAGNYSQWLKMVQNYIAGFTPQEQENILHKNAERFYNL